MYTESPTCFRMHLMMCKTYIHKTIMRKFQDNNPFQPPSVVRTTQSEIDFPRLTPSQKSALDIKATMWCCMGNHPFTIFEDPFGIAFLRDLNPAYKPPSRKAISGPLLNS